MKKCETIEFLYRNIAEHIVLRISTIYMNKDVVCVGNEGFKCN